MYGTFTPRLIHHVDIWLMMVVGAGGKWMCSLLGACEVRVYGLEEPAL